MQRDFAASQCNKEGPMDTNLILTTTQGLYFNKLSPVIALRNPRNTSQTAISIVQA